MTPREFVRKRDKMLMSNNPRVWRKYADEMGVPFPANPDVAKVGILKARTGATTLPMSVRSDAKFQLAMLGYSGLDDGEVPWWSQSADRGTDRGTDTENGAD